MKIYCTRPHCSGPENHFPELDQPEKLITVPQKYCSKCGMPLILAGRYLPQKILGEGGFGAAFLATDRHTRSQRKCVVKQFKPPTNLSPQQLKLAQKLFEREAQVLEELGDQHPQIPQLYAFFPLIVEEEQFFYLVQEFIDGQNLETELETRGKFSPPEVLDLLKEMLNILKFIHEYEPSDPEMKPPTIHRDIKPANIMRDKKGKLYLLDFGAVKVTSRAIDPKKNPTQIYTPGYAAPEQTTVGEVYPCTDLYALAITCLVLLTGKLPSELYKNNRVTWRENIELSDKLGDAIDRMTKQDHEERFQSAQLVLDFLVPSELVPPLPSEVPKVYTPKFNLIQILSGAGFVGSQGTLLIIAIASFFPLPITLIISGILLLGLISGIYFRVLEKWDLITIPIISLGLVWLISPLHQILITHGLGKFFVAFFPILGAAGAIAATTLFLLVYKVLSLIIK
ncbi:serine/threonine-protein kinase [Gloeocapsa sp. PCC 73106]|uniref:serine/threonine-protein kinase n=1 Tax=Gloeocapsa sp. PCC 73106 TaxID=102232 RepID=UPI0002AD1AD5|nr:serine/threonine-protein kinase [Gloeocapsa sp. PCC 73106]ELR97262.1 serine/threonine protein kinase [Gloeocapsa sp. PCC 73106]